MTAVNTKAPSGAAFFRSGAAQSAGRRLAAVGLAGALLGGGLIMAPAAQAADLGWTPSPTKTVVGSTSEKGDLGQNLIDNLGVFPGQKVEYNIGVDLNVDPDAAAVTSLGLNDELPSGFVVDESTIRIVGNTNNIALTPRSDYTFKIVDNSLKIAFSSAWITAHVGPTSSVPITWPTFMPWYNTGLASLMPLTSAYLA